jgi:hypothetical protein
VTLRRIDAWLAVVLASAFVLTPAPARATGTPPTKVGSHEIDDESSDAGEVNDGSASSMGAEVDAGARFVWRGIALSGGSVAQPSIWASGLGFTASVWANVLLDDEESGAPRPARARSTTKARTWVNAVVPAVTYTYAWRAWRVEPGALVYVNRGGIAPQTTGEASVNVACVLGSLAFVTRNNVDVGSYAGAYFGTLGAEYERSSRKLTLKAFLDLGWATEKFNAAYLHTSTAALNVVEAGLAARYDLSDTFFVMPHAEVSALLVPSATVRERVLVNGGAALGVEF